MTPSLNIKKPLANIDVETMMRACEASRSPLIITDYALPDNPIIYSNQAFVDLIGYTMVDVIGRNCRFLQGADTDPKTITALRTAVKKGTYIRVTIKNYKKDGTMFWNDLVMSPIKNAKGETTHFMGMQLDVTDRIVAEERLRSKTEELERSNHELEQFTYATSHDLQEPLRMINSYLQLLNKRYGDVFDEDAKTFIGFATEGAERMQDLIYDLLTLSRISNDHDRFKDVRMNEVVDRALFNLKSSIEDSHATVNVEALPTLSSDPVQMTQLLQNLISNGIKYTKKGRRPSITISAKKQDDSYVFTVKDNGIGIATQHFQRIFTIFQRLHTRAEYPGTGVGLAICSKIIERHGGRIWVESEEGKGAAFTFTLPITREALS